MITKLMVVIALLATVLQAESDSYIRTKIKNRSRVQTSHPDKFEGSRYNYTDDLDVKQGDSKFGNVNVDDAKTKKVYNYVDIKKHIRTNESIEAGNVKIGKKGKVKGVYSYTHINSVKARDSADIGNLDVEQKRVHGEFDTHTEVEKIEIR